MRRSIVILAVLFSIFLISGCLYTHTVQPLSPNMHRTPVVFNSGQGDIKQITIYNISAIWGDNSIGSIAKEKGLTELYFADLEILRVLGIYTQRTVHVYGK